jgi:hypothetical protein
MRACYLMWSPDPVLWLIEFQSNFNFQVSFNFQFYVIGGSIARLCSPVYPQTPQFRTNYQIGPEVKWGAAAPFATE